VLHQAGDRAEPGPRLATVIQLKSLIGYFNLLPNHVLDIIIESLECQPVGGSWVGSFFVDGSVIQMITSPARLLLCNHRLL
jgi:hypothetical protein